MWKFALMDQILNPIVSSNDYWIDDLIINMFYE